MKTFFRSILILVLIILLVISSGVIYIKFHGKALVRQWIEQSVGERIVYQKLSYRMPFQFVMKGIVGDNLWKIERAKIDFKIKDAKAFLKQVFRQEEILVLPAKVMLLNIQLAAPAQKEVGSVVPETIDIQTFIELEIARQDFQVLKMTFEGDLILPDGLLKEK